MKHGCRTLAFGACLLIGLFDLSAGAAGAADGWRGYENPQWGYRVAYPGYMFPQSDPADQRGDVTLQTPDGRAKLLFFAGPNRLQLDANGVAKELARVDARVVTYTRVADNWVVLSGYVNQGPGGSRDTIFYERVNLSLDRRVMAGFRLEYPADMRSEIDHLIGRIGKSLTAPRDVPLGGAVSAAPAAAQSPSFSDESGAASNSRPSNPADEHTSQCRAKYPSYNDATDTFRRFDGVRVPCTGVGGDQ